MMQVYLNYKKCVIHHQPMLPVKPNSGLFENLKVAEEENTYDSPIDGLTQNRLVEKVSLEVYVNPNPITFTSLPAKFQRHMVDPQRITPEDLNLAARRRCLLICQNLGGTKCGQEELCLSMFCGIVVRPSRIMDVLSISIVEQVFAISAASIITVEA